MLNPRKERESCESLPRIHSSAAPPNREYHPFIHPLHHGARAKRLRASSPTMAPSHSSHGNGGGSKLAHIKSPPLSKLFQFTGRSSSNAAAPGKPMRAFDPTFFLYIRLPSTLGSCEPCTNHYPQGLGSRLGAWPVISAMRAKPTAHPTRPWQTRHLIRRLQTTSSFRTVLMTCTPAIKHTA